MSKFLKQASALLMLGNIFVYSPMILAEEYRIDSFEFAMGAPIGTGTAGVPIGTGPYGTIVENTYQGTNSTNVLVNFEFFTVVVHVYTAATNQGSTNTPAGTLTGGPAPTIDPIAGTADLSSWFAEWNGTEFVQGNPSATVTNHFDNTLTVDWSAYIPGTPGPTNPFGGQTGYWRLELTCISCADTILDPADELTVTQATYTVLTVGQSDGPVVVASSKGLNPPNTTFDWTASDASITDTDGDEGTFTFDPAAVPAGVYTISHSYADTTNLPTNINTGTGSIQIRVVSDSVSNHFDTDLDGIPDANDSASLTAQQLQSEYDNAATYVMSTDLGTLKVGETGFCVSAGARITHTDIIDHGGANCSAVTNAADEVIKAIGVGGFFDFTITGLTAGDTVNVVLPLTEAIPPHATYRKYARVGGWSIFETNDTDAVASAASTSAGVCPPPGDAAYTSGLTQGNTCVQLTITDGGNNDTDGSVNGQIKDPGGVAEIQSGVEAKLSGCSLSGKPQTLDRHAEWLLLAAFIAWLGFVSRRTKKN